MPVAPHRPPEGDELRVLVAIVRLADAIGAMPSNRQVAAEMNACGIDHHQVGRMVYRLTQRGMLFRQSRRWGDFIITEKGRTLAEREVVRRG